MAKDVIKSLKEFCWIIQLSPKCNHLYLCKINIQLRRPCEERGRNCNGLAILQGIARIASNYQKLVDSHETDSPLES